ncbi:class I SAM-dependent methyltransferase [Candidatus Falkowbacteria bacterium]|nr:class I SAM-dependent methyltransferase [Candidatus Falkowbacteria bacterium]
MKTLNSNEENNLEIKKNNLLASLKPSEIADNFPLFITRQEMARYLVRYELFKKILNVKGSIIECGVYKGASLMFFAKMSAVYEPYAFNREIIGFDTFAGFPSVDNKDGALAYAGDLSDVNLEILEKSIELFDNNRPIGHVSKIKLVKGDAVKTIPQYFIENPHTVVAMLYLDFDIYEPTLAALKTILPRMPKGAIIVFDELNERRWPGETLALLEALDINKHEIKKFSEDPHISYIEL